MTRYGYGPARVISSFSKMRMTLALNTVPHMKRPSVSMFGRARCEPCIGGVLINDRNPDPQEGQRKGWHYDLYNMLLMNLSEKREAATWPFRAPVQERASRCSGGRHRQRFRLVPKIQGGMLPVVWTAAEVIAENAVDGRRATVIDLEIDSDRRADAAEATEAFCRAARWLPAIETARSVGSRNRG